MACKPYKNTDLTKEDFLKALEEEEGNEYAAYTKIGLPFNRYMQWREEDEEFVAAIKQLKTKTTQWVENKMFDFIHGNIGDPQTQARMAQFYLKCKGGYVETKRVEAEVKSDNTVNLNDALDEIRKELEEN